MKNLKLTKHFVERWQERVGNYPTEAAVRHFIRHSIPVQRGEDVIRGDGTPFRMLGIYWHPALDMVIMCDESRHAAVTVLTRENWSGDGSDGTAVLEFCKRSSHVPTARIERVKALFGKRAAFI